MKSTQYNLLQFFFCKLLGKIRYNLRVFANDFGVDVGCVKSKEFRRNFQLKPILPGLEKIVRYYLHAFTAVSGQSLS